MSNTRLHNKKMLILYYSDLYKRSIWVLIPSNILFMSMDEEKDFIKKNILRRYKVQGLRKIFSQIKMKINE